MTSAHRHPPTTGESDTAGFRLPLESTMRVGARCASPGQRRWRQRGNAHEGVTAFQPDSVRRHPRGGACGSWRYSPGHRRWPTSRPGNPPITADLGTSRDSVVHPRVALEHTLELRSATRTDA